ncbi:MAG: aldose epimerase family protein [Spirochaetia bacterium]
MRITEKSFGKLYGKDIPLFEIENTNGISFSACPYGAVLVSVITPDRDGKFDCITLKLSSIEGYTQDNPYFGATVGRVANRISDAAFTVNDSRYTLEQNDGNNHLHSGKSGISKKLWNIEQASSDEGIIFQCESPDKEGGYPGNVQFSCKYKLTEENELIIEYSAETDKATPINMTNHSYWNLSGDPTKAVLDHTLQINSRYYLPKTQHGLPTGEVLRTENTLFDFTKEKRLENSEIMLSSGLDHCYIVSSDKEVFSRITHPFSGRRMMMSTESPGVHVYTGNWLNTFGNIENTHFPRFGGICLEPEELPNAVNIRHFPSIILQPGEQYSRKTRIRFDTLH